MTRLTRSLAAGAALTVAAGIGVRAYYGSRDAATPEITTAVITRGAIAETVAATGSLQAVTTVQVGTQVSGTVAWLGADFNSIVRRNQVVARLDPSLFETQVEQARASRVRATAELDNVRVRADEAQQKYDRALELDRRQLVPQSEVDAARAARDSAGAAVRSAGAQLVQAEAALHQAELNLSHTVIRAPIDGIVIGRSVDVGQTVAASLQSPTIFTIAADLARMQLSVSVDESDIGRIRPGQAVTFEVGAYADRVFAGTVSQVRLQPTVVQNVTTYSVIADVPNAGLELKPGMTANVIVEVAARDDVLRVPNAALRFRPSEAVLASLGAGAGAQRDSDEGRGAAPRVGPPVRPQQDPRQPGAETPSTIDALFAPLAPPDTPGRVWVLADGRLQPLPVRVGVSDGQFSELLAGGLAEGAPVVTAISTGAGTSVRTPVPAGGLFMPGPGPGSRGGQPGGGG